MTGAPHVEILADHSLLLALPAFAPAVLVVGVVVWVAMRDRRSGGDDDETGDGPHSDRPASIDEDQGP